MIKFNSQNSRKLSLFLLSGGDKENGGNEIRLVLTMVTNIFSNHPFGYNSKSETMSIGVFGRNIN